MEHARIAIVGTGFSGIGMAIRLKQEGIDDFVVLEKADEVGGTWRDNTYPGCSCDVVSHLYSFSFAPNPDWSAMLAPQPEIQAYLRRCVDEAGVRPHLRLGHELTSAEWDEGAARWRIETSRGAFSVQMVVQATGGLSDPLIPDIPGAERFEGAAFHSSRWDHNHDVTGERVAVVGTGASAIQIVPAIQPQVERLLVLQRTPPWVLPRPEGDMSPRMRRIFRRVPLAQRLLRAALFAMYESIGIGYRRMWVMPLVEPLVWAIAKRQLTKPELRERLRPRYRLGCKRVVFSNDWYGALSQPNVDVVTEGIRELREHSIVTADGAEHEVDTIVWATGFHVTDPLTVDRVRGREGVVLGELWRRESPHALRGTTVPGFPNYFILVGPNTGTGNNSLIVAIEAQIEYVLDCLRTIDARRLAAVEARPDAEEQWNRWVQERLQGTVFTAGCSSHYLDRHGRNTFIWPGFMTGFRTQVRRFDPAEYVLYPAAASAGAGDGRRSLTTTFTPR